jgi:hypothetical protein
MTDTKDLLAQAQVALEAERMQAQAAMDALNATNDSLSAANVQLQAQLDTANATIAQLQAQNDPWALVDKTGATDVTDKVQALISKGVAVPAGKYLIDAVKGLKVASAKLDPNAILVAKPNGQPRYCMVEVSGSIEGGQIIGDRDTHDYSTITSTHEWGYGLKLLDGAKATGVQVSKCTGDGVAVVGDNVTLDHVISRFNRRQGMSVFSCTGLRAYDCEFTDTSGAPNGPCAGVDFEPDNGSITDARLERCVSRNNRAGFLAWVRQTVSGNVDVTLVDCITDNNANGVHAKGLDGKAYLHMQGGKHTNRSANCRVESGSVFDIAGCTFAFTGKDRTDFTLTGMDSRTKYDIQFPTTTGLPNGTAKVGTNSYV